MPRLYIHKSLTQHKPTMQKYIFLALCCGTFLHATNAQTGTGTQVPANRDYATQLRLRQLQSTDPWVKDTMASVERFTSDFRQFGYVDTTSVALVFHLMPLPGGATLPGTADLQAQIDRLNTDFFAPEHPYLSESYQHPSLLFDTLGNITGTQADVQSYLHEADQKEGFAQHAGLPLIRFCLASTDPNGQPTGGVIYPTATARVWSIGDSLCHSEFGGSAPWHTMRYCNIWIARLTDNYAGYAQLPGGPEETDGIVIDDRFFARAVSDTTNPYRLGKTLSHLMGSYLNLYELWNDYLPCGDDYVEDTPIHNGSNNGLPSYGYRHVSTCGGNPVEMISNLMDNSVDSIQYLFTWGQVMRMQATLSENGPRRGLRYTQTACSTNFSVVPGPVDRSDLAETNDKDDFTLQVYPNPATGSFTIEIQSVQEATAQIQIHNTFGSLIYHQSELLPAGVFRRHIDASGWYPGFYAISIITRDKRVTRKILME